MKMKFICQTSNEHLLCARPRYTNTWFQSQKEKVTQDERQCCAVVRGVDWTQTAWAQITVLLLPGSVALGKELNLSGP